MLVGIQSAIDIATDLIAEERFRKPARYRETFEILGENEILPEPRTRDLSALAGSRNVLVLTAFRDAIQEHLHDRSSGNP